MDGSWQDLLSRICSKGTPFTKKLTCLGAPQCIEDLVALRDFMEVLPLPSQAEFVSKFLPWALQQLKSTKISLDGSSAEHSARFLIVALMRVLSTFVEAVRPFIDSIMPALLSIMVNDADDVAVEAMQLFTEMNKAFRSAVEEFVPPFLDFILELARDFEKITKARLQDQRPAQQRESKPCYISRESSRLLHDAPVMIVLIFQLHRRFINEYIPKFVPVVVKLLEVDAERPPCNLSDIRSLEDLSSDAFPSPRGAFNDFIAAQIKVLSFLAYIARGFAPTLREYKDTIPKIVVRLLTRCPPEAAPARKELLVAVRHILSTELRQSFLPQLDILMDEKLLLGEGYTAHYIFRPAAYSMLADLIHHVRLELDSQILDRVISMYSRALHDPTLPNGIQTMSIKLLLNLVDAISNDKFPSIKRRDFLIRILTTLLLKFEWLQKAISELLNLRKTNQGISTFDEKRYDPFFDDPLKARPIPADSLALDPSRDNIRDFKFQLKTLINGVKNLLLALRATPISETNNSTGFTSDEGEMFMVKLFRDGILCFDIFYFKFPSEEFIGDASNSTTHITSTQPSTIPPDEKDLMDQFGYIFTLLEPSLFHDVISSNMDFLIERTKENIALVSVPQYFLAISGISKGFATVLARHVVDRFEEVGSPNPIAGAVILRLFKLLFLAVSVYPEENESVLQPYLAEIILSCFRHYPKAATPVNYFLLLRSLFRSIGGGRFDSLYKEVLPLLQTILDELTHLSPSTADPSLRDMYVELCLTTPVRLSNLLPYLSYLMKPVLLALQSGTDLVNQGLRTFELCIDNLTPDFLEPILAPVFTDILSSLWKMLKPPPANQLHSHTAVRLLGKLGGKSQRFLTTPPSYANRKAVGSGLFFEFRFDLPPIKSMHVSCDSIARIAMFTINSPTRDLQARIQALNFLKRAMASILGHYGVRENLEDITERLATLFDKSQGQATASENGRESNHTLSHEMDINVLLETNNLNVKNTITDEASRQLLCEIVCALFDAFVHPELREEISVILTSFYRLLVLIYISRNEQQQRVFGCLDFDVLTDIMMEYTTVQNEVQANLAWEVLRGMHEQHTLCIPDREVQFEHKVLFLVADKVISACFRTNTWQRVAACRTISRLCDLDLSLRFYWHHEIRLIRGVLYVMKSLPSGASAKYSEELTSVVFKVLRLANRIDKSDKLSRTEDFMAQHQQYFDQVMLALVTELSNPNAVVRDAVKASFQLLSDIQGCEVTDLLTPLKSRVYGPIFSKPLRALPLHVQVGYIDAITYCLALRPPLLELHEELLRLVNEAVTVIEAEDSTLITRANQAHNASNLLSLRLVCIRLLSTCLSSAEFQQARLHPLRNQIVSVFFKTLYARQPELVDVSRAALEQVMAQQHKLPTELLQNGLRPVLQSLGEPRHLNLSAVEGLRRILQLFSHFFKAEIGRKLLDHLHAWADQQANEAAKTSQHEGAEVKVITAIMELFCLLPSCGQLFMGDLIQVVLQLESVLKRRASSPFRPVLLRFMELYSQDAIAYLLDNVSNESVVALFSAIIGLPSANKIVAELAKIMENILDAFHSKGCSAELCIRYLVLFRQYLLKHAPQLSEPNVEAYGRYIQKFWEHLGLVSARNHDSDPLENLVAKLVYESTLIFVNAQPGQIDCAFSVLKIVCLPQVVDTTDLTLFFRNWLRKCTPAILHEVHIKWLRLCDDPNTNFMIKERATRLLIQPIASVIEKYTESERDLILDDKVFAMINKTIWDRDCRQCENGSCVIAVEEIQLTVLLMDVMKKCWPKRAAQYQSHITKFLLNRVQSLDCSVRYSALYTFGLTLIEVQAPPQDLLQVIAALLCAPSADIRAILRLGFDLFLPYLARQGESIRDQLVTKLTSCLSRDAFIMTLVLSLWQTISLHSEEMLPIASALIPALVASFSKCGPVAFSAAESRNSTLDLASTIFSWHIRLKDSSPLRKSPHMAEQIVNGLIRILCSLPDYSDTTIFDRGLEILKLYMQGFCQNDRILKLAGLERMLGSLENYDEQQIPMINCGIRLLNTIIESRANRLVAGDLSQYERWVLVLLERCPGKALEAFGGLLTSIFFNLAQDDMPPSSVEDLKDSIITSIVEGLNSGRNNPICFAAIKADSTNLLPADTILPVFARSFQRAVREHISRQDTSVNSNPPEIQAAQLFSRQIIIPGLEYGVRNIAHPDLPRTVFLGSLQTLWEHSVNGELMKILLEQVLTWTRSADPVPSLREKVELLLVPCKSDPLNDPRLMEIFLDITYEIYSRNAYAKTELRSRLEGAFIWGLRCENNTKRRNFIDLLDSSIPRNILARLRHIFETQRWELAGSHYWIPMAIELVLEAASENGTTVAPIDSFKLSPEWLANNMSVCGDIVPLFNLLNDASSSTTREHVRNIGALASMDNRLAHGLWIALFPAIWAELGPETHTYLNGRLTRIIANDSFLCQARLRPNIIKSVIESLLNCQPLPSIPPFLIAYAMRTYATWYSGCSYLEKLFEKMPVDINPAETATKEQPWSELVSSMGAMYRELGENDFMFGVYRRGFLLNETNIALSFDQIDLWPQAQKLIEGAMSKCRAGTIPFSEAEFSVWEQRWTTGAKELQQWDLLTEISRADMDAELGLECLWRLADWGSTDTHTAASNLIKSCAEPTSRLKFFEAFLTITQNREQVDRFNHFQTLVEEALQLALNEWQSLPAHPCPAHAQILHNFQMLVEIQESLALYSNLANTSGGVASLSRPQFLADLKGLLTAWRERLPNSWDEMNFWSDILAWRQHVFSAINSAFAPLASESSSGVNPQNQTAASSSATSHPFAFRGYHEMAWLINRFAHVARKNNMTDVCLSFLNRIYTLPNIEIQDAFLKLREQAKCYMDTPTDLPIALEVVNATNLNYFSGLQKGEFFALRSVILSRLGMIEEANRVFAQAVQIDLNMGHGWAAWGRFNDQRFSQQQDINLAVNAINCYLQAATLFKAHKSRRFLARILWLLTFEDSVGSLGKSFEMYNHDLPTWFWVSFVPQLLASLARKEQRQARFVLIKIAKNYPQALYLPLRTFHEDCRLQYGTRPVAGGNGKKNCTFIMYLDVKSQSPTPSAAQSQMGLPQTANASPQVSQSPFPPVVGDHTQNDLSTLARKHPFESAEDLLSILKTGYPLLALTMENAMEHVVHRLRSSVDEDFYRVLTSLIGEAYQHIMNRISGHGGTTGQTNALMESSLRRVYTMICNSSSLSPIYKADFENDFMALESSDPNAVLGRLFTWRNKLEPSLRRHPRQLVLDGLSRFLAEFEYHRYDDIDVPGQYLLMRDGSQDFVKIDKFDALVPVVRRHGTSYRRLVIRGSDGQLYPFAVQNPAGRQTRREERILQLFRFLDVALKRSLDGRRRNLYFNVPAVVPISAHVRLVADDPAHVTFEEILERYCEQRGITSDQVFLYFKEQILTALPSISQEAPRVNVELLNLRTDLFTNIISKIIPSTVLARYMDQMTLFAAEQWVYRRDFIRQFGTSIFQNYIFSIGHRFLHKIGFSKKSTAAIQTEILPMVTASGQISLIEIVPFRFSPNLQEYVTPIGTEGVLLSSIVSCGRYLSKAESDLNELLSVFVRDELLLWYLNYCSIQQQQLQQPQMGVNNDAGDSQSAKPGPVIGEIVENPFEKLEAAGIDEKTFFSRVQQNCELIMKRAQTLSCIKEQEQVAEHPAPLFQTVLDLLSSATNPQKLAQMDGHWHPWF